MFSAASAARVLLVAAAVGAVIALIAGQRDEDRCNAAGRAVFAWGLGHASRSVIAPSLRTLESCGGTEAKLAAVRGLVRRRMPAEAIRVARAATRGEPRNALAWAGLALALRATDPAAADRALARTRRLDPRYGRRPGRGPPGRSAIRQQSDGGP